MGLAVGTHAYADALDSDYSEEVEYLRGQLRALDKLLIGEGLSAHIEPDTHGPAATRDPAGGVPYSFVHYLRRAYAHARRFPDRPLEPLAEGEDPTEDSAVDELVYLFDSHLLCHSDCEGYYVPAEFDEVLFPDDELGIPGGMVGSSPALLRELVFVAPYLGITLVDDLLSDSEIERLDRENGDDEHPLYRERETWLVFYEAARVSVANGTLIHFC